MIDTGASLSLVHQSYLPKRCTVVPYTGPSLMTAANVPLGPIGQVDLRLTLAGVDHMVSFAVVESSAVSLILGLDFLAETGILVDSRQRGLRLPDDRFVLALEAYDGVPVRVRDSTTIPARHAAYVAVSSDIQGLHTIDALPGVEDAKCCFIARDTSEHRRFVHVTNYAERPLTLQAGSCIAVASPVETVMAVSEAEVKVQELQKKVDSSGLRRHERQRLTALLLRYRDVFADESRPFGRVVGTEHAIDTANAAPRSQGLRPTGPKARETVREEVGKMLESGVIRPSNSPWASPIVLVKKKDGSVRFCVDFRKLNDETVKDVYPLPRISDMLEALSTGVYFSTLDAACGYWQIVMRERDKHKTAFICTEGLFEFEVMPFGLCNAPATYQRLMNLMLAGLTWKSCLVYLDDILVFSASFEAHLADLEEVLKRLRTAGMLLKVSKCFFALKSVAYLGHVVSAEGIRADPAKVAKIRAYPTPRSLPELRSFLGLAGYYRRFIKSFSIVATPLFELMGKARPWEWSPDCEQAFRRLTEAIATESVLHHPQFGLPFIVDTDACDRGLGAVLSQVIDKVERPICFASRLLQPAERVWHTQEKEALAIIWALQQFRHFVLGAEFVVRTDHFSLQLLQKAKTGRLARWACQLAEFGSFPIMHRDGTKHCNADALSRLPVPESDATPDHATAFLIAPDVRAIPSLEDIAAAQATDASILKLVKVCPSVRAVNGVQGFGDQPFKPLLPLSMVEAVAKLFHEPPHHGHLGAKRTLEKVRDHFTLAGTQWKVREVIMNCLPCKQRKAPLPRHGKLASSPAKGPGETVAMDFTGPFPTSESGNRFILVFVDWFTKWVEIVPLPDQVAATVVRAFYDRIICRHGCPRRLLSDRGPQFTSGLMQAVCDAFQIQKIFSSAYYPQGDGQAERFMRTMKDSLSVVAGRFVSQWDEYLPAIAFAYNTSVNAATGFSPFELVFGRKPAFPEINAFARALEDKASAGSLPSSLVYFREIATTLAEVRAKAIDNLEKSWREMRRRYDASRKDIRLQPGDAVLIRLSDYERNNFPSRGLAPRWSEPGEIVELLSNQKTYRVRRDDGSIESINVARLLPVTGAMWQEEEMQEDEDSDIIVEIDPHEDARLALAWRGKNC